MKTGLVTRSLEKGAVYELLPSDPFHAFLIRMAEVRKAKGHDYGEKSDSFANLRRCEEMGIPAWKGVLIRMSDKFQRLVSFSKQGEFKVNDEGLEDTLLDMANYSIICALLHRESKK